MFRIMSVGVESLIMRIIGVRWQPVSRILCVLYAVLGLSSFLYWLFTDVDSLTLPLGVIAPLLNFSFNFHLPRTANFVLLVIYGLAETATYAISGWVTGAAVALVFNFAARRMGGIDAKYLITEESANQQPATLPAP
jgi:ABC-type phosphate/phosphonate transport system permease subunit